MTSTLFYILAALTTASTLSVVVSQNIVRAATWLLFALAGTAGIFFLLGADFLGATQLLVYVGGTLVLVVFGVMLTASGPFVSMKVSAAEWALNLAVGLLLYAVLAVVLVQVQPQVASDDGKGMKPIAAPKDGESLALSKTLGAALLGDTGATPVTNVTGTRLKGRDRKRMAYLLPFEIVSVHLLVVLVGAAYLARAKRRREAA